jgi:ribosomal protein S18 acetylase RimI-like enzyme
MFIKYCTVTADEELHQILALQKENHASTLTKSAAIADGFVTVTHSFDLLRQMNVAAPQVIAKDEKKVVGYALVMLTSFASVIPVLQPMFDQLSTIKYENGKITDRPFYIMGQICIHQSYRGQGVFDGLYRAHQALHAGEYDLCLTSVSPRNQRSKRAHERVGFRTVHTFSDATDEWNILVWPLSTGK